MAYRTRLNIFSRHSRRFARSRGFRWLRGLLALLGFIVARICISVLRELKRLQESEIRSEKTRVNEYSRNVILQIQFFSKVCYINVRTFYRVEAAKF